MLGSIIEEVGLPEEAPDFEFLPRPESTESDVGSGSASIGSASTSGEESEHDLFSRDPTMLDPQVSLEHRFSRAVHCRLTGRFLGESRPVGQNISCSCAAHGPDLALKALPSQR